MCVCEYVCVRLYKCASNTWQQTPPLPNMEWVYQGNCFWSDNPYDLLDCEKNRSLTDAFLTNTQRYFKTFIPQRCQGSPKFIYLKVSFDQLYFPCVF